MRDEPPHPDAGVEKRERTIRDTGDERLFAEWYQGRQAGGHTYIRHREGADTETLLTADVNELGALLDALTAAKGALSSGESAPGRQLVRDMGAFERVCVEWDTGVACLTVEALGTTEHMLILAEPEVAELADAVEEAAEELPEVDCGPHL